MLLEGGFTECIYAVHICSWSSLTADGGSDRTKGSHKPLCQSDFVGRNHKPSENERGQFDPSSTKPRQHECLYRSDLLFPRFVTLTAIPSPELFRCSAAMDDQKAVKMTAATTNCHRAWPIRLKIGPMMTSPSTCPDPAAHYCGQWRVDPRLHMREEGIWGGGHMPNDSVWREKI